MNASGEYPDRLSCLRCLSGFFGFQGVRAFRVLLVTAHITDAVVVDLRGLRHVLRPSYLFFMSHDLLSKQPQQFRRQFRNVRVSLRLGEETIRPAYRFPQVLDS